MSADPDANQNFESSQVKSFASLDNAINPDAKAANTPAVLRAENQDAKSLVKENIEKDLSSEYGNEFDPQQPYGDEFDVEGTEVLTLEQLKYKAQPENSEGGSSSSTEGEGDDKPLRPGGMVPGQARAEPNTYINADQESKKSGLTRRDGTTLSGTTGSNAGALASIFCNVTIKYAKDQNVTYSNTTGGGSTGKQSAEALGNSLNEASEQSLPPSIPGEGPYTIEDFPGLENTSATTQFRHLKHMNSLDPSVQAQFAGAINEWNATYGQNGDYMWLTSGYRNNQEQAELYAKFLAGGPLAASPGNSWHQHGIAGDVAIIRNGKEDWNPSSYIQANTIFNKYGLTNTIVDDDLPHFMPIGLPATLPDSIKNGSISGSDYVKGKR